MQEKIWDKQVYIYIKITHLFTVLIATPVYGYLHSVDWSAGMECWNGVKHWSGPVTTLGKVSMIKL